MDGIPYLYKKLLSRLNKDMELDLREFKKQITFVRISKQEWKEILKDLERLGLAKKKNKRKVIILQGFIISTHATAIMLLYFLFFLYYAILLAI